MRGIYICLMYLRKQDYDRFIQGDNLSQIISKDETIRLTAEFAAKEEIESQLSGKYDTDAEFTDTPVFSITETYTEGARAQYEFDAYAEQTYAVGDYVSRFGLAFVCNTAVTAPEEFDPAKWTEIGKENNLYYLSNVYPVFEVKNVYKTGDTVFWKGKVYTATTPTVIPDDYTKLQSGVISNIPPLNPMPGTPTGLKMWGSGVVYLISGARPDLKLPDYSAWSSGTTYAIGNRVKYNNVLYQATAASTGKTPGDSTAYWIAFNWTLGDNRSQLIVMNMIDIGLFHIHSRIAPRNIPELRVKRYDAAKKWLKDANMGNVTPKLQLIQVPNSGTMILYGGNVKNINTY